MTDRVKKAVQEIIVFHSKDGNEVGGNLHITLDDENCEDHHVQFCLDQAKIRNDADGVRLAELLLTLTEEEREQAVEVYWNRPHQIHNN